MNKGNAKEDGTEPSVCSPVRAGGSRQPIYFTLTVAALVLVMIISLRYISNIFLAVEKDKIKSELSTMNRSAQHNLNSWIETQMSIVDAWSLDPRITDSAEKLKKTPLNEIASSEIHKKLRAHLNPLFRGTSFNGYSIVDSSGLSLASSQDLKVGSENYLWKLEPHFFNRLSSNKLAVSAPVKSDTKVRTGDNALTMFVGAPISRGDVIIAYFVVKLNLDKEFYSVLERSRFGVSGETFAVNKSGVVLSRSRFVNDLRAKGVLSENQNAPLNLSIKKNIWQSGVTDDIEGYLSYRDVKSVGAWTWMDKLQIGIVTEVEYSEAYVTYFVLNDFIYTLGVSFGSMLFLSLVICRILIQNINRSQLNEKVLKKAKSEAEEANKAKSAFLANMSHEIRTPIHTITSLTTLCLEDAETGSSQSRKLVKIKSSATHLLSLINGILDISKIEAGAVELQTTDIHLEQMLQEISDIIVPQVSEKQIEFLFKIDIDTPLHVYGDDMKLKQVLVNLCSNAVKFTETGEVIIRVVQKQVEKNRCLISFSVEDSGIGITAEQIKILFKAFSQADPSISRDFGGTGLGLAICKEYVELMGGKIDISSQYGVGSIFSFSLWFDIPPKYPGVPEQVIEIPDGTKVLFIDEKQILTDHLRGLSSKLGFTIVCVSSIEKLDRIMDHGAGSKFDIVILNSDYKNEIGDCLLRKVKRLAGESSIPVVALTSEKYHTAGRIECDYSVSKPFTNSGLLKTMSLALVNISAAEDNRNSHFPVPPRLLNNKILIVEDNQINREIVGILLGQAGFEYDFAVNGRAAVQKVKNGDYQLILMDIQMPEMDGYEATQKIRELGCNIPIIALTANAQSGEKSKALDAGMNHFLTKPVFDVELYSVITEYLEQGTSESQNKTLAMLVDDDSTCRSIFKTILNKLGIEVLDYSNGEAFEEALNEYKPDIIFLDIRLQGITGLELCKKVRAEKKNCRGVPILGMSAEIDNISRAELKKSGLDELILKDFNPRKIMALVSEYTKLKKPLKSVEKSRPSGEESTQLARPLQIDENLALEYLGNRETFIKILKIFYDDYNEIAENFDSVFSGYSEKEKDLFVHTVKGAAGFIGAFTLKDNAEVFLTSLRKKEIPAGGEQEFKSSLLLTIREAEKLIDFSCVE